MKAISLIDYYKKLTKRFYIFDLEADGLLDTATKIHCLSMGWIDNNGSYQIKSTTDYSEMRKFFTSDCIKIGHNIIDYDIPVAKKLLGCDVNDETLIDTLGLSWYLEPTIKRHGLEAWGEYFGIKKPKVDDWQNQPAEVYINRCQEDIKINFKLYNKQLKHLKTIYDNDMIEVERLIDYLQFKMFCVKEQENNPLKFNYLSAANLVDNMKAEKKLKYDILARSMPKIEQVKSKLYKNALRISDDEFYVEGDMMYDYYLSMGYKPGDMSIETVKKVLEPNPDSPVQKKDWLYSLGWIPETFKYEKEEDGTQRKIPQIMSDKKDGTVCESVKKLFAIAPELEELEGYSILSHRISLVEGLLKSQENGYIKASMAGFTNTLRLKHKGVVNLPGVDKKYGKEIRGLLIADDEDLLCGSDCSGLEDNCKQHYMYPYDPKYIKEMRTPGWDAHLDIALLSGMLTEKQVNDHKSGKANYKKERAKAKTVNFASVYGAGAAKIAQSSGMTLKEAKLLHTIYWERNKAVKDVAKSFVVKEVNGQKWLFNPVSKLWYSLRAEKDRFSTGNQGLGVWCFDTWVKHVREAGITVNYQCHDEILFRLNGKSKEDAIIILNKAMEKTNKELNLNVPLSISIDFGCNYSETH